MRCYMHDDKLGYMVFTKVTIKGLTREMWLPVMDYKNKAMIDNATMFDINKTIMRCLTKNLAMFGLGLYIYAGEDLPTDEPKQMITEAQKKDIGAPAVKKDAAKLTALLSELYERIDALEDTMQTAVSLRNTAEQSQYYKNEVLSAMKALRTVADAAEKVVPSDKWPFPTYATLLFGV